MKKLYSQKKKLSIGFPFWGAENLSNGCSGVPLTLIPSLRFGTWGFEKIMRSVFAFDFFKTHNL